MIQPIHYRSVPCPSRDFARLIFLFAITISHVFAQDTLLSVTTLAGRASHGSQDGEPGRAKFSGPVGITLDGEGNLIVADTSNCTIRRISPSGVTTTIAGLAGFPGATEGFGSAARFNYPHGVAVDRNGVIYVADTGSSTIRKITPSGLVSTLAGLAGVSGYVEGASGVARFNQPRGLAVDAAGNLIVADTGNNRIRKITPAGVVSRIDGNDPAPFSASNFNDGFVGGGRYYQPEGIVVDAQDNIYIADTGNFAVRVITNTGFVRTLDRNPLGFPYIQSRPRGVAVDAAGNLFVADDNGTVLQFPKAGGKITVTGAPVVPPATVDGTTTNARFISPSGIAVAPSGNVFVSDASDNAIRLITPAGTVTTFAGTKLNAAAEGIDGTPDLARLIRPRSVAKDNLENVYVVDTHGLRMISPTGVVSTVVRTNLITTDPNGAGGTSPVSVAADRAGNVYVADLNRTIGKIVQGRVVPIAGRFDRTENVDGVGTGAAFGGYNGLEGAIACDAAGNIYLAETTNNTIRKITPTGVVTTIAGAPFPAPRDRLDGVGTNARFAAPIAITVDGDGNVYVVDGGGSTTVLGIRIPARIRRITPALAVSTIETPEGVIQSIGAITCDSANNLYISDYTKNTLFRVLPSGAVKAMAGRWVLPGALDVTLAAYTPGSTDGVGVNARFYQAFGLGADRSGNIFIADTLNHAVRMATPVISAPEIRMQPADRTVAVGQPVTFSVETGAGTPSTYQWQRNGITISGAASAALVLGSPQPANTGLYTAVVTGGTVTLSDPAVLGISSSAKVVGSGVELLSNQFVALNNNTFDQVGLQGVAATITADPQQITRMSFVDMNDDIVQVEFSGAGSLSLVLESPSGPAAPVKYNQGGVTYMKGHAGIVIVGANETTNVSVFSVGSLTAANQTLFKSGVSYDGVADIAFIAIVSANGRFGGVRTANAGYLATAGYAGIYAPDVHFSGPVFVGDITASDAGYGMLVLGSGTDVRVTGGDLLQPNGRPVQVRGIAQLKFMSGSTSHGTPLAVQTNRATLVQSGVDVTSLIVAYPR